MTKNILIFFSIMMINISYSEINITNPLSTDADALQRLNLELGYDLTEEVITIKIQSFLNSDVNKLWVAKLNDKIVGFISLNILESFHAKGKYARIDSLLVSERYRGLGIGKKLVQFIENYAKQMGCDKVILSSNNKRVEAHKFYEKMGYISDSRYFIKKLKWE